MTSREKTLKKRCRHVVSWIINGQLYKLRGVIVGQYGSYQLCGCELRTTEGGKD